MAPTTAQAARRSKSGFDLTPPSREQFVMLAADLDEEERRIILDHGTERAFCGVFNAAKELGTYVCRLCGLPFFRSGAKFESGTGWPSFFTPVDREHISFIRDFSYGMIRTEIRCARCDGHLGHVFNDGPPPTGERYCMNSASMRFVAEGDPLPDLLGRGAPEGKPFG
jgi:peptide-methionine (R)-S-oxide reductase